MFIPDPGSEVFPSRIRIKSDFTPNKFIISSRKYDPGGSSGILVPDPHPDFLPIADSGDKKAPDHTGTYLRGLFLAEISGKVPRSSLEMKTREFTTYHAYGKTVRNLESTELRTRSIVFTGLKWYRTSFLKKNQTRIQKRCSGFTGLPV